MPVTESLDAKIARYAPEFADQVLQAAEMAANEEEIRLEVHTQLRRLQKEFEIELDSSHEFTVATGRIDSVYDHVIVEYKNPANAASRIGATLDSPGTRAVVAQIKSRFQPLKDVRKRELDSIFGVGCDGRRFVFVRWRDGEWLLEQPVDITAKTAERFLWALFNLGKSGKALLPAYLAGDFGSDAELARRAVAAFYEAIRTTADPKALVFFQQWKVLFGAVCGFDVQTPTEKIKQLAKHYGIEGKVDPPALLFAVHTYYAVFMKFLAAAIVATFHNQKSPIHEMVGAPEDGALLRALMDIERGGVFRHFNVTNFLEGDLFSWYTTAWTSAIADAVREILRTLDTYNPRTLAEDPDASRDLLKKLYQQLFPKSVRHDLGEYYTPDWLAEHVLERVGYDGDPDRRVLDPACGSGTFLVMAIGRIRRWFEGNKHRCGYGAAELAKRILTNVVGFDLNPLAVLAARTNYLIAIRDLIDDVENVEIPVFMCDSVTTPSNVGGMLFANSTDAVKQLPSAVGPFQIPVEAARERVTLGLYTDILERCVTDGCSDAVFEKHCIAAGISFKEGDVHRRLLARLRELATEGRNGIWARIIKNAFAPIFEGRSFDFVIGNPPWVNYENLPAEYREASEEVWRNYGLVPEGNWRARFAKGHTELAMVFLYACLDNYMEPAGRLAFVITQSVFQSRQTGRGFRRFRLANSRPVRIHAVDDMCALQPFDGAVNRTAVVVASLEGETHYPVRYVRWRGQRSRRMTSDWPLDKVLGATVRHEGVAAPIGDSASPWIAVDDASLLAVPSRLAKRPRGYRAWEGSNTRGGNGYFWLRPLGAKRGILLCENTPEFSKKKPKPRHVKWGFEPDLVFPLLRGREVGRWHATPSLAILFPHQGDAAIAEDELKTTYPRTFGYLNEFRGELTARRMYDLSRRKLAFYSLFETGQFLRAPFKVVWKEIASSFQCAVVGPAQVPFVENKIVIPDHKLLVVPLKRAQDAHYLCAALNSSIARFIVRSYAVDTQISTHVLDYVPVPPFDDEDAVHIELADLSKTCHRLVAAEKPDELRNPEERIDVLAAKLWGIKKSELAAMVKALREDEKGDESQSDEEPEDDQR